MWEDTQTYFICTLRGREGELLHKDVPAVAPLKKQQMCTAAEPEASCSRAVGQQHSKPCHRRSQAGSEQKRPDGHVRMERREYAGRGNAVQGLQDKKDFELLDSTGTSAGAGWMMKCLQAVV